MNEPNIVHKFNEDNPHVLEKLMKEIIQQEDDQVILGNRLMMLRQVNRGWRTAVEGCLPHFEALTIEVFSSKPADFEKEAEESNNTSSILRNEEFKHVRDIAGEFGRLSALTEHDVAFELKGPLLRVHFEALPALVRSLQEGVLARVDHRTGKPLQMKTRTLSLAIIDRYRHQRNGPSVVGDPLNAYQPLLDLEALFSPDHLETLYLTIRLNEPSASFFEALISGMVERRRGGALRSLDLHAVHLNNRSLDLLIPQLEHLGLHSQKQLKLAPFLESLATVTPAPTKLRSLKLPDRFRLWGVGVSPPILWHPSPAVASLLAGLTTLELSVSSELRHLSILMSFCRALVSLKLYCTKEDYYNDFDFTCLRPVGQSLRHLTLVNFDLKRSGSLNRDFYNVLPEVTTLTMVNHHLFLRAHQPDMQANYRRRMHSHLLYHQPINYKPSDMGCLVRELFGPFRKLKQLTLMGPVIEDRLLREQLTNRLSKNKRDFKLQLHFVKYSNQVRKPNQKRPIDQKEVPQKKVVAAEAPTQPRCS